jgi:hypothetical protein
MAAVLMFALRGRIDSGFIHEVTIPVVMVALGIVGFQEWTNCEKASASPLARQREERDA